MSFKSASLILKSQSKVGIDWNILFIKYCSPKYWAFSAFFFFLIESFYTQEKDACIGSEHSLSLSLSLSLSKIDGLMNVFYLRSI